MEQTETRVSFADLGLGSDILADLAEMGYEQPTPIQRLAIPPVLEGRDVVGIAQTGTGKTAAFSLPLIQRLEAGRGTVVLILSPTRELAIQTHDFVADMGRRRGFRPVVIIGGERYGGQDRALADRPEVVVGSPGRVFDQIQRGRIETHGIEALVLDEADRLLDMGFAPQIDDIVKRLPRERQSLLFSATMPSGIKALARTYMTDPIDVSVGPNLSPVEQCHQETYVTSSREKTVLLKYLLRQREGQVLVFTRMRRTADQIYRAVWASGHDVTVLHADRDQSERRRAMDGFRAGHYRILVATDIAARGLDIEDIAHVINYDLPPTAEDYVHRVGRTARAEREGTATSLVTIEDLKALRLIEMGIGRKIPTITIPREQLLDFWRDEAGREHDVAQQRGSGASPPGLSRSRGGGNSRGGSAARSGGPNGGSGRRGPSRGSVSSRGPSRGRGAGDRAQGSGGSSRGRSGRGRRR